MTPSWWTYTATSARTPSTPAGPLRTQRNAQSTPVRLDRVRAMAQGLWPPTPTGATAKRRSSPNTNSSAYRPSGPPSRGYTTSSARAVRRPTGTPPHPENRYHEPGTAGAVPGRQQELPPNPDRTPTGPGPTGPEPHSRSPLIHLLSFCSPRLRM